MTSTNRTETKEQIIEIYRQMLQLNLQVLKIIQDEKPIIDRRTLGALRDDARLRKAHIERSIGWIKEDIKND